MDRSGPTHEKRVSKKECVPQNQKSVPVFLINMRQKMELFPNSQPASAEMRHRLRQKLQSPPCRRLKFPAFCRWNSTFAVI